MIFNSHLISMTVFAAITSFILALIRYRDKKQILRYTVKSFLMMTGGVIAGAWVLHFL